MVLLYVQTQVQFQAILAVLNLTLILFYGILLSFVTIINRQGAQLAVAFSTFLSFLNATIGEIKRHKIRTKKNKEILNDINQGFSIKSDIPLVSPFSDAFSTNNQAHTNSHERQKANPQQVNKATVFIMSVVLFIFSYSYHPFSIAFGIISQPVSSRYEQPLLFAANKTYNLNTFDKHQLYPLYPVDADYSEVEQYEKQNLTSNIFDDSISGNSFQILGTTFYKSGNLSCGLRDEFSVLILKSPNELLSVSSQIQMSPTIECLIDTGITGVPNRSTILSYDFGDNEHKTYVKSIGKIPKEGDNFTIFSIVENDIDNRHVNLTTMTVFLDDFKNNLTTAYDTHEAIKYVKDNMVTLDYSESDPIYGAINNGTRNSNYNLLTNLTMFNTYLNAYIVRRYDITMIMTVKDKEKDRKNPMFQHYVRNSIFAMTDENLENEKYYHISSTILSYRTSFKVYENTNRAITPTGKPLFTNLHDEDENVMAKKSILIIPPMTNIKILPTAISIVSAFIPEVKFAFMDLNFQYGHRLKYDVTALVITIAIVIGLSCILGLICHTIFKKSSSRRIPLYYNLLRDYHEQGKRTSDTLIEIVKPAYQGTGLVYSSRQPFNHIGVLNLESARNKPSGPLRYLGKRGSEKNFLVAKEPRK